MRQATSRTCGSYQLNLYGSALTKPNLNTQEWDDLFEASYQQNMRQKAAREKRVDNNQKRQLLMQRNDTEDLYTLKVRLETEVQDLEQQLEDMRATYQVVAGLFFFFLFVRASRKQRGAGPEAAARGHVALRPHTLVA